MSVVSRLAGYFSLAKDVNKSKGSEQEEAVEGVSGGLLPELELSMDDKELTDLTAKWKRKWNDSPKKAKLEKVQKENEKYWLGKQYDHVQETGENRPLVDNLIFESLEQALPVATKENPEPMVGADNSDEGRQLAETLQKMLVYLADILALKLKLKRITRYWALYLIGVLEVGWDKEEDEISLNVIRPQKCVFDPDATINEVGEYQGEYFGIVCEELASELKENYPKSAKFIDNLTQSEGGTTLKYTRWWTTEYTCAELDGEILEKTKNPHFNYDAKKEKTIDEMGQETEQETPARNHFKNPKIPFVFLSIFNLGKQPFDDTSLIGQNLPLQDLINKRQRQIDKNADKMNAGSVWSLDNLTAEQAKAADKAIQNGGSVAVPGDVNRNHKSVPGTPLPGDVFNQLSDVRNELKDIFGTRGFGAGGLAGQRTVRGMAYLSQADTIRMGGEITDYLEQFTDTVFNWMVQMIYVYWDEPHEGAVVGLNKAFEYIQLQSSMLDRKLTVTVKQGSMLPRDEMSDAKQASDLAGAGLLDPITLYTRLDFPNPKETAKNLYLWKTNPIALFPDLQQQQAQQQQGQPQGGQPQQGGQGGMPPQGGPPQGSGPVGPPGQGMPVPAEIPAGQLAPSTSFIPNI